MSCYCIFLGFSFAYISLIKGDVSDSIIFQPKFSTLVTILNSLSAITSNRSAVSEYDGRVFCWLYQLEIISCFFHVNLTFSFTNLTNKLSWSIMYQKQHLLVCIILLFILTLLMLVHFGEIIIMLHCLKS